MEFKQLLACILEVLNLNSTNISFSELFEENSEKSCLPKHL